MRTVSEQIAGLGLVAEDLSERRISCAIFVAPYADPPVLRTEHHSGLELVFAVGGYDTWSTSSQALARTDLTFEQAVDVMASGAERGHA